MSEGSILNVSIELAISGALACELVVTLLATPGTATGKKKSIVIYVNIYPFLSLSIQMKTMLCQ